MNYSKNNFLKRNWYGVGFLPVFNLLNDLNKEVKSKFYLKLTGHPLYIVMGILYIGMGLEEEIWNPLDYPRVKNAQEVIKKEEVNQKSLVKILIGENEDSS